MTNIVSSTIHIIDCSSSSRPAASLVLPPSGAEHQTMSVLSAIPLDLAAGMDITSMVLNASPTTLQNLARGLESESVGLFTGTVRVRGLRRSVPRFPHAIQHRSAQPSPFREEVFSGAFRRTDGAHAQVADSIALVIAGKPSLIRWCQNAIPTGHGAHGLDEMIKEQLAQPLSPTATLSKKYTAEPTKQEVKLRNEERQRRPPCDARDVDAASSNSTSAVNESKVDLSDQYEGTRSSFVLLLSTRGSGVLGDDEDAAGRNHEFHDV
nr:unnamed protein product [Digitaria exilis]CAB3504574.1 unnamed protein product [Digitaria exilis]